MSAILAILLSAIPRVSLAIIAKLVTDDILQAVMEKVLVAGLERAAAMTTNQVDDELVTVVKSKLLTKEQK